MAVIVKMGLVILIGPSLFLEETVDVYAGIQVINSGFTTVLLFSILFFAQKMIIF